MHSRRT